MNDKAAHQGGGIPIHKGEDSHISLSPSPHLSPLITAKTIRKESISLLPQAYFFVTNENL